VVNFPSIYKKLINSFLIQELLEEDYVGGDQESTLPANCEWCAFLCFESSQFSISKEEDDARIDELFQ